MVDGVRSSDDPLDLWAASRDLWPGGTLDFWQGREAPRPALVVWPESEEQVAAVLADAAANGKVVVPYGAGSGVCGGARGRSGAVVVDLKAMDRIGPLDEERRMVTCQAGVNGQHLEDWLNARGYTLGHSPSSIWCSTVGGWAAARSAGQFSSWYGVFEDMVLALTMVTPARTVTVGLGSEEPAGLMGVALGSEGTLGVITSVTMRVAPLPAVRRLRGYRFADVETTVRAMRELMQAELWPAVVRMYDPVDTRIGGRTKPKRAPGPRRFYREWLSAVDQMPAARRRTLALPLALPGVLNKVLDKVASDCLLIVGWEGDSEVVEATASAGEALLASLGTDLGTAPGDRWFHSRHAVSYKLAPVFERGGFADTMEGACRWSELVRLYHAIRQALSPNVVVMAHMSHVYPEGGSIYFSFAGRGDRAVYDRTWAAALEACHRVGATVTHHHGVGTLKAAQAAAEVGPAIAGYRAFKGELDPTGTMNPGVVYADARGLAHPPPPPLVVDDGLVRGPDHASRAAELGLEVMFPYESLPAPPRWQRCRWQLGWTEVSGDYEGKQVCLGRGPRSAAGPDLRPWLAEHGSGVRFAVPAVPEGSRWLGVGTPDEPWAVARQLLRTGLRPAVLGVVEGQLHVGFRGPAASALGEIAGRRVPGGLNERPYVPLPLPSGQLAACPDDHDGVVSVTPASAWRRAT
jgi:alkyldihydroxyacetonephosphate synthase